MSLIIHATIALAATVYVKHMILIVLEIIPGTNMVDATPGNKRTRINYSLENLC